MKLTQDIYKDGKWLQRTHIGGKFTWTVSGVLWNNIKERTTPGSATQRREPTYKGAENKFESFEKFVLWNRNQIGYGLGYDLDSDILLKNKKVYSEDTCLLIPPALNRFLQSRKKQRTQDLPTGLLRTGNKILVRNSIKDDISGKDIDLVYCYVNTIQDGILIYEESVEKSKQIWINRLENSGRYQVDPRVVHFLKNWKYVSEWNTSE